ncbi:MAG: Bor family protein [Bdellovibrio sp.]|nr:MAG: Bor family protein [Bdellovibrio sp.]
MIKIISLGVSALMFAACSTVTISPPGKTTVVSTEPTYKDSKPFFLLGIVGEETVDVQKICSGPPIQMQTQNTFLDSFLAIITIGIYTPKTVKVWCQGGRNS